MGKSILTCEVSRNCGELMEELEVGLEVLVMLDSVSGEVLLYNRDWLE